MNIQSVSYGKLCSLFYDITETYACEQEVSFYASFIHENLGRTLEAMSGSGRLQIPLLQQGYVVDGVDSSSIMLDRCRDRCKDFGLEPVLYEQSLEALAIDAVYSTITIAVGSFQLIINRATALKSLQNLRAHMHDHGALLIDTFTPDRTIDPRSIRFARIDCRTIIRLTTRHVFDEKKRHANSFCLYELLVDGIVQQQENELIQVTWYTDNEWQQLLYEAGFELVTIYDKTFCDSSSSRIIHARALSN